MKLVAINGREAAFGGGRTQAHLCCYKRRTTLKGGVRNASALVVGGGDGDLLVR